MKQHDDIDEDYEDEDEDEDEDILEDIWEIEAHLLAHWVSTGKAMTMRELVKASGRPQRWLRRWLVLEDWGTIDAEREGRRWTFRPSEERVRTHIRVLWATTDAVPTLDHIAAGVLDRGGTLRPNVAPGSEPAGGPKA